MDIRNIREFKQTAARRTAEAPQQKRILLIYCGITMGLSVLTLVVRYVLGLQIDRFGGLSNLGTRAMLSTFQSALPLIQSLVTMCMELGYLAAMLRVARGQYASPNTLRLGFDRFWALLRCMLVQGLIYGGMAVAAVYAGSMIFVMSPWSGPFMEQIAPMLAEVSLLEPQMVIEESDVMALLPSMVPMFIIAGLLALILVGPTAYRFRMARYVIIDKPGRGALFALSESRKMMRGNSLKLLKLDLSWWWYYLALAAISGLGSLDLYLAEFGVALPMSADAAYFLFYFLSLGLQLVVFYFLRNRIEVSYALAYDVVKPEEPKNGGVVLGNIFTM